MNARESRSETEPIRRRILGRRNREQAFLLAANRKRTSLKQSRATTIFRAHELYLFRQATTDERSAAFARLLSPAASRRGNSWRKASSETGRANPCSTEKRSRSREERAPSVLLEHVAFQPTLPVRGATQGPRLLRAGQLISTHAPRAGSDPAGTAARPRAPHFNPRSPCGERPSRAWMKNHLSQGFQPTLPVRGATLAGNARLLGAGISTHAPRAGSDGESWGYFAVHSISTHAPRAGSDGSMLIATVPATYFNPRSPCGERRDLYVTYADGGQFQPTLPVRGATQLDVLAIRCSRISTHAPRAGSDKR